MILLSKNDRENILLQKYRIIKVFTDDFIFFENFFSQKFETTFRENFFLPQIDPESNVSVFRRSNLYEKDSFDPC